MTPVAFSLTRWQKSWTTSKPTSASSSAVRTSLSASSTVPSSSSATPWNFCFADRKPLVSVSNMGGGIYHGFGPSPPPTPPGARGRGPFDRSRSVLVGHDREGAPRPPAGPGGRQRPGPRQGRGEMEQFPPGLTRLQLDDHVLGYLDD